MARQTIAGMAFDLSSLQRRAQPLLRPVQPLIDATELWLQAGGPRMSAAMSFYGILSLAPLLVVVVGLLGWWLDRSYVESTLIGQVQGVAGERVAQVVQGALSSARRADEGSLASALGLVMMVSGATGVFVELQASLEKLWSVGEPPLVRQRAAWWSLAMARVRGLSYVGGLGFLLLVSMLLSTMIQLVTKWAGDQLQLVPLGPLLRVINESVSFVIEVILFLGLMRIGQGIKPRVRHLLWGAVVGAVLFTLGKQGLAWYLSTAAVVSAYGAAGSLVVVLMWFYFTSAILLFSAATAKACSRCDMRLPHLWRGRGGDAQDKPAQGNGPQPGHAGENI